MYCTVLCMVMSYHELRMRASLVRTSNLQSSKSKLSEFGKVILVQYVCATSNADNQTIEREPSGFAATAWVVTGETSSRHLKRGKIHSAAGENNNKYSAGLLENCFPNG
jgi:hypothetical protein